MAAPPQLRVLFFDVFGTCVNQRSTVADELSNASQQALDSNVSSIDPQVVIKAKQMTYDDWFDFGGEWNKRDDEFVRESKAKQGNVDWRAVDKHRIALLPKLLAERGLIILEEDSSTSGFSVVEGSLWNDSQLQHLGTVWHRLTPWPDTCRGMDLLSTKYLTVALSNTYNELIKSLVAHGNIPFSQVFSSDMFNSYKPNPKVYLGAVEKMGVKPEECGLVAAHLSDLKGAKACGFFTISVERPLEEKNPELRKENIPDIIVSEDEDGFVTLAERLGIRSGR